MSIHTETKRKLKQIPKISTFCELIDSCTLSDEDKLILKMLYIQNKSLSYIADTLGYAESTIKKRHSKILKKLSKIL